MTQITDDVNIHFSEQLVAFKKAVFHTPLTNEIELQLLKEKLSNGVYEIKSCSLADKLLEHFQPFKHVEMA